MSSIERKVLIILSTITCLAMLSLATFLSYSVLQVLNVWPGLMLVGLIVWVIGRYVIFEILDVIEILKKDTL